LGLYGRGSLGNVQGALSKESDLTAKHLALLTSK